MVTIVEEEIVHELRSEWKKLWHDRFDDKVRAEGIASCDYPLLDVERGLVVVATRDYVSPDFVTILKKHNAFLLPPSMGGWGKFIRGTVSKQKKTMKKRESFVLLTPKHNENQQKKNGGKGWLHI